MEDECMHGSQKRKHRETKQHSPAQIVASLMSIREEKPLQSGNYVTRLAELRSLKERLDILELYEMALCSSIASCVGDLTLVPMYLLDYHMRRLFLEKKKKAIDPKRYKALFVGKGKRKPFKGTFGYEIRYFYLLRCYLRLIGKDHDNDTHGEGKNVGSANEQLECFEDLLQSSEDCLLAALSFCGATNVEAFKIRHEAKAILESEDKWLLDPGTHTFTRLFYQQRYTPLEKQRLQDKVFPPENDVIFRLTNPAALSRMGLTVLALADIEKRLIAPYASPFQLEPTTPTLVRAGVDIIKCFIMLKGNVNESIEFRYGSLSTTMGENKRTKSIDLLAIDH